MTTRSTITRGPVSHRPSDGSGNGPTPRPCCAIGQRPTLEPWPDGPQLAVLAAAALRANEVVSISIDPPPLDNGPARAVDFPLLGRRAHLLPGVVALAELTGAPVLMGFLYRGADYR